MTSFLRLFAVVAGVFVIASPPSAAFAAICPVGAQPGATLLFPYFELDLDDPEGPTTQISISNVSAEPVLSHIVLWTNWGEPTLAFDLYLRGNEVRPMDLRRIFTEGQLPSTGGFGSDIPSCNDPLDLPSLGPSVRALLTAKHTGQPVGDLCFGAPTDLAEGFVTVDVVSSCSESIEVPGEAGYFGEGGIAAYDNVLAGDFFFLDSAGDSAQGLTALSLPADAERFNGSSTTFYSTTLGDDHRMPLNHVQRLRFLEGGSFDGGTSALVWSSRFETSFEGIECTSLSTGRALLFDFYSEEGDVLNFVGLSEHRVTGRYPIGVGEVLETTENFGHMTVEGSRVGGILIPTNFAVNTWATSLIKAEGRFSVSASGTAIAGPCF